MSPLRDLLAQGSFLVLTDWAGRGTVLGTRVTLGGDVLVAVSPGFAVAPDGGAIALHRDRVEAALAQVRRVHRRIRIAAWCAAAAPSAVAGASAGFAAEAGAGAGLVSYAWAAGAALLAAPAWRWARGLGLRLAWRVVQRRLFSAG
jgi:hypothetical protein